MESEETTEKGGKGKLFGIIGAVVVLGLGGYMFLGGGGGEEDPEAATTTTVAVEGAVIEADEMTVNLADAETTRYARIRFGVVLPVDGDSTTVGERFPIMKDAVLTVVSNFTASDLLGSGGIDALRNQLSDKAQEVWPDGEVLRVVVTEVLVQ